MNRSLVLVFSLPSLKGKEWPLAPEGKTTLGRDRSNDIVVADASVSRFHCEFVWENGVCTVRDLGSRNGVRVNGEAVEKSSLKPGDVLQVGNVSAEVTFSRRKEGEEEREPEIVRVETLSKYRYHPDPTVEKFLLGHRGESAVTVISLPQFAWYGAVLAALFLLFNYDWLYFLSVVNLLVASFYIVTILYRLFTVICAVVKRKEVIVSEKETALLPEDSLPVYTVLLPLYREKEVTGKIIRAVEELEYPPEKLDVKILLEADDRETLDACLRKGLPPYCEIVVVPDVAPKTKPRACNHGLARARGKYLVVYDAEDRPEPDQLKKAVVAFDRHPEVSCFQCKLNYYNQHQNMLTRWFTVEYSAWFDLFLPGLHSQGAPIPLGGTSNHFRTDVLRAVGGWDPFNVTEDADLGIRLYKRGHRTRVLDSTTWEEANSRLANWIRQRSRWIKGYFQTHLVHMRRPFRTLAALGPHGLFSFLLTVGGMAFMMLLNPIYWLAAFLYGALLSWDVWQGKHLWDVLADKGRVVLWHGLFPVRENYHAWRMIFVSPEDSHFWSVVSVVFFCITGALLAANIVFIVINALAVTRRKLKGMAFAVLTSPVYWVLISIAAWKGFLQLFYKPFFWEKTIHGYTDE